MVREVWPHFLCYVRKVRGRKTATKTQVLGY
jgi:hypothetical protein